MDHSAVLLWIFGWRWLLLLQLFMAGTSALLSKANVVTRRWLCAGLGGHHTAAHNMWVHPKARGGLLGQECLSGEAHPS